MAGGNNIFPGGKGCKNTLQQRSLSELVFSLGLTQLLSEQGIGVTRAGMIHTLHACLQLCRPREPTVKVAFSRAPGREPGPPLRKRALRSCSVYSLCVSAFFGIIAESGPAWSFLCSGS